MKQFSVVQSWLDNVAYSHSGSANTEEEYERHFTRFCKFIGLRPGDILEQYEEATDRAFKRKYAQYLKAWISKLLRAGYTKGTIRVMVACVKSFFKYQDLPLGYVPMSKAQVVFHNRDITKEEIVRIMGVSRVRDRAFFAVMAQSGLRPHTLCLLRVKHVELNREAPAKIDVPLEIAKGKYRSYFTFIGPDALRLLKDYLNTRENLTFGSYLFSQHAIEKKLMRNTLSSRFKDAVLKLRKKSLVEYTQKAKGKAGTIRLYSLRKWFRKQAHQAGFEIVQFWMGHIVKEGQEEHYRPKDVEFHRALYREKAMPYLALETETPGEMKKIVERQAEEIERLKKETEKLRAQAVENADLKQRIQQTEKKLGELERLIREALETAT